MLGIFLNLHLDFQENNDKNKDCQLSLSLHSSIGGRQIDVFYVISISGLILLVLWLQFHL